MLAFQTVRVKRNRLFLTPTGFWQTLLGSNDSTRSAAFFFSSKLLSAPYPISDVFAKTVLLPLYFRQWRRVSRSLALSRARNSATGGREAFAVQR